MQLCFAWVEVMFCLLPRSIWDKCYKPEREKNAGKAEQSINTLFNNGVGDGGRDHSTH